MEKVLKSLKKHSKALLIFADTAAIILAIGISTILKFDVVSDKFLPEWYQSNIFYITGADFVITLFLFLIFRIYNRMWQYPVAKDYAELFFAFCTSKVITGLCFGYIWFLGNTRSFLTWFALYVALDGIFVFAARVLELLAYRYWRIKYLLPAEKASSDKKRVMIVGAGSAASRLITEFRSQEQRSSYEVVALMDDNHRKQGEYLNGVKVYGGRDRIVSVANELHIDEIFLAIPSLSSEKRKEILDICKETNCVLKMLPGLNSLIQGNSMGNQLRKVNYTDLLGRDPIRADLSGAFRMLKGKTVMVTGGGGSIGSELVRQIAKSGMAKRIVIFDIAENGAYDIQQEIRRTLPGVDLRVLIGSVRDEQRLCEVFEEFHPDIVYHAAAHKHVPLMEDSPKEAVKNNVFGTLNLARTADRYNVERFVMISTDKAVNPTNVMGATKRICEMIVQTFNHSSSTEFVAVRFGNVLGSNGSVIPLFKEQIEAGGPVTVTHPEIIRYFMLIPEAVSLVLQAGAFARGGEIFILDMGSPVKIKELAENMIRLSGYRPGVDIAIKYTGLREGEKLYEELLVSEEGLQKTENDLIYIAKPVQLDAELLFSQLTDLDDNIERFSRPEIIDKLEEIVPTYTANNKEYNDSKLQTADK